MDSENKQRISLYLDWDTVKKADKMMKEYGFKSRNEFYTESVESCIADELLQENDSALWEKLARAVAELSENNAKAISKGLFRYAVQLEMVMRMIATLSDISDREMEDMRRETINNVRRTHGKVNLKDIINGYYNECERFDKFLLSLDIQKPLWYCVVLRKDVILWQIEDRRVTEWCESAMTDVGKAESLSVTKRTAIPYIDMFLQERKKN